MTVYENMSALIIWYIFVVKICPSRKGLKGHLTKHPPFYFRISHCHTTLSSYLSEQRGKNSIAPLFAKKWHSEGLSFCTLLGAPFLLSFLVAGDLSDVPSVLGHYTLAEHCVIWPPSPQGLRPFHFLYKQTSRVSTGRNYAEAINDQIVGCAKIELYQPQVEAIFPNP